MDGKPINLAAIINISLSTSQWDEDFCELKGKYSSFSFYNPSLGIAVGDNGMITIYSEGTEIIPTTQKNNNLNYQLQNYPNPFNPTTTISYQLPAAGYVSLKVYDALGSEVVTLVDEDQQAGFYTTNFDASSLPSGVYFYRIEAGNFITTKNMILLR